MLSIDTRNVFVIKFLPTFSIWTCLNNSFVSLIDDVLNLKKYHKCYVTEKTIKHTLYRGSPPA